MFYFNGVQQHRDRDVFFSWDTIPIGIITCNEHELIKLGLNPIGRKSSNTFKLSSIIVTSFNFS